MNLLTALALAFAIVAIFFFFGAVSRLKRRRPLGSLLATLVGLVFLLLALLAGAIVVGTHGYRALVYEEVAANVITEPLSEGTFRARFLLADGEARVYELSGDQLYVDAHILKWKPLVNLLGLHTAYELDRVAGRYARLEDEQTRPRTVYSLAASKPFNFFDIARRVPLLDPLVDAEYGSASFVPARQGGAYELRVSTTGLLFRALQPGPAPGR